jgi:hypothetical protein
MTRLRPKVVALSMSCGGGGSRTSERPVLTEMAAGIVRRVAPAEARVVEPVT